MILVLKPGTGSDDVNALLGRIEDAGLKPLHLPGVERTVLGAIGDERVLQGMNLDGHPAVDRIQPILSPYKLVSRELHPHDTVVDVGGVVVGGERFVVIAGPCSVESPEQMSETAGAVVAEGATLLRGGAFKPRTSPYAFQGLGVQGLQMLRDASHAVGAPAFTEVMEPGDVEIVAEYAAGFQIGARSMQSSRLLKAVGQHHKPVLLKRGPSASVENLLLAAEYIVAEGNPNVILCERGITTFETATRNTLDLNAIPLLKQRSHLPVIVDPSHGTGVRSLVAPMALAAAAAGADGLLVEVHRRPQEALSDAAQQLTPTDFADLMRRLRPVVEAVGRTL